MLTKDVRDWLEKVERRQYSYEDAMFELTRVSNYLTKDELIWLKERLQNSYKA